MIEAKDLNFSYDVDILKNIAFSISESSICTIIGPNGSGKSTLLKILDKLLKPKKGTVLIENENLEKLSIKNVAKKIAYLAQENEVSFSFSVFDVVLTGRAHNVGMLSQPSKEDIKIAKKAISLVGLQNLINKPFTQLSGGQKRLVLIAQALAQEAKILLFDEPTNHLDFSNQYAILNLIKNLIKKHNLTAIITLHDPNLAAWISDVVIMIKNGSLLKFGSVKSIMNAQNLSELYEIKITVINNNGKLFITPLEFI
ncbi:ABC transporter ATP-binding protein [Desulfurella sp.]|uniref:ABC transporter ATP-binding protein n=1 Tax=Desulfurella sp. TaxID=1962857 RepID=UPI0025BDA3B1|nr:ABC transporter ATP-binding protein [Desulfurella sp.]